LRSREADENYFVQQLEIIVFSTTSIKRRTESGKRMSIKELSGEQRRQLIDTQQVFDTWRQAHHEANHRFAGSMRWGERNGTDYLLRKIGQAERSLGRRGVETERIYDAFVSGRAENRDRLAGLTNRLDELAPVNRALGLGRVPVIAARILRECDEAGLLGEHLTIVGTNALYAYEAQAGVHTESDLVASLDIDLLYDARRRLSLALTGVRTAGLIGLLRAVDTSFAPIRPRTFRAANRDGYLVDLIRPEARDPTRDKSKPALTDLPEDLEGAAIFGLGWLVNSPKMDVVAIDERGYPVRMVVIDPRAFALHKAWVSSREDREPVKARRDFQQAQAAALIATRYLRRTFESTELDALPKELRELAPKIAPANGDGSKRLTKPNW
jgi:hypothetical protein